jgi:hypothetical protein
MAGLGQRLSAVLKAEPEVPMPLDIAVWTACADESKSRSAAATALR